MSIGFGIERKLNKYLGIEIGIDNWYRYGDGVTEKVMSETNSGLSLSLCLHPLVYKRNALDFYAGYGLNFMHWTNIKGGQGRHLFLGSPILGVGYYRSYNNFKLGFVYKYQHLQRRLEADSNQQFLLSFSKSF
ncbi:MAG: hypothetical protein PF541_15140 [Prolixibacteraceae bacterium]|nr:hypothetical protein [Prolixibacteraceae bacterium]